MKSTQFNYIVALFLIVFVFSCSSTKHLNSKNTVANDFESELHIDRKHTKNPFFEESEKEEKWVDSVYSQMTFNEKVGQLFMVAAYSNKDSIHVNSIEKLIKESKIGGLIFFQGGPVRQANLTNRFQSKSKLPLFIGIDAEWGLSMRLDSTYKYPWNMTLGAIRDSKLIEKSNNLYA